MGDDIQLMCENTQLGSDEILNKYLQSNVNNFNIAHMNVCSFSPKNNSHKIDFFKSLKNWRNVSAFVITESWLKGYISNKSIEIDGFNVVRNDRVGRRGGGVAIYLNANLKYKTIANSVKSDIEYLFIEVCLDNEKLLIGGIYRPRGNLSSIDGIMTDLCTQYQHIFLMGDFNFDLSDEIKLNLMKNYWDTFGLKIIFNPNKPTHFDAQYNSLSIIDCCITNVPDLIISTNQFWLPGISHHSILFTSFNMNHLKTDTTFSYYDYNSINDDLLFHSILNSEIDNIFDLDNANEQNILLSTILKEMFECHVPQKQVIIKKKSPIWYTTGVKSMCILPLRPIEEIEITKTGKLTQKFVIRLIH